MEWFWYKKSCLLLLDCFVVGFYFIKGIRNLIFCVFLYLKRWDIYVWNLCPFEHTKFGIVKHILTCWNVCADISAAFWLNDCPLQTILRSPKSVQHTWLWIDITLPSELHFKWFIMFYKLCLFSFNMFWWN